MPATPPAARVIDHFTPPDCLTPELTMVGYDRHPRSFLYLVPHIHPQAYEIVFLLSGSVEWWVGPEVHQVRRGDLFLTAPGEEHGGIDSMIHPCELVFCQVRIPARAALTGLTIPQTRTIRRGFAAIRRHCFPGSPAARAALLRLHQAHHDRHDHQDHHDQPRRRQRDLYTIEAQSALHDTLVAVLRDYRAAAEHPAAAPTRTPAIRAALAWMDAHLDDDFRVHHVAAAVGLGVSRFHERFLAEVGFPPGEYRTRRRIALARQLLVRGHLPVTTIALRLGFSSSQYFATTFKKIVGLTPQAYRHTHAPPRPAHACAPASVDRV
jgi:AraC-like DNA-binding protein